MQKLGLLPRVLIAIVLGIGFSFFAPEWAARIFVTFNGLFGNFLGMFIPILIIGLIAPSIAELGKGAGKLLLITAALAYFSTVCCGFISYFTCKLTLPSLLQGQASAIRGFDMDGGLAPYFTVDMPAFINVTTALIISFILGLGCATIKSDAFKQVLFDLRDIVTLTIQKAIVPCLPIFIFGIFLKMGVDGKVFPLMGMFSKIIVVIICLHIGVLICQFLIAGAFSGKNPVKSLLTMMPAYATALGTQSSAATIPVTLNCVKKLGVKDQIAEFTVPLCANIHMPCSILKITACAFAVSICLGMPADLFTYTGFILMLAITMVAAPGVPGGAVMASLGVLSSSLGFGAEAQGFVIVIYVVLDCFGTAGNVTGDGALALIVNKINNRL